MKKLTVLFVIVLQLQIAFAQIPFLRIIPDSSIGTATSAIVDENIVILQSEHKICAVDIISNKTIWQNKLPYIAYAGSLSLMSIKGMFHIHALKDGLSQTEILYTVDSYTGIVKDSIELIGTTIIRIFPIPGNKNEVGFIGQDKGKFTSSILNTSTGNITHTFFKESDKGSTIPNAIAFSNDGKWAVVSLLNDLYEVRLYSMSDGKLQFTVPVPKLEIHDMEFSNDNKYIYWADSKESLWKVNMETHQIENKWITGSKHGHISLSKDDKYAILSGWESAPVVRVDLNTGNITKSNFKATSFSCETDINGRYAVVTARGMGPYYSSKYPYCVLYSISPENELKEYKNSNITSIYKPGDMVEVLWSELWYKAEVLETKNDQYKIHYIGYGSEWDEWVVSNRIKPVTSLPSLIK